MIIRKRHSHLLGAVENWAMKTSDYAERLLRHELSKAQIPDGVRESDLLNVAMEVLYKVATCEGHCRKGDRIIESLAGRGFNLASSAMILTSIGYYDEALNLIRSLGELTNLLGYLVLHPDDYPSWVLASKKDSARNQSSETNLCLQLKKRRTLSFAKWQRR